MDEDLKALEQKLAKLVARYQSLLAENEHLRQEVADVQQARDQMKQNMSLASKRLASLIERLPPDDLREELL